MKITKKEWELLKQHLLTNMNWKEGGTFNRESTSREKEKGAEDYVFDPKEANRVLATLARVEGHLTRYWDYDKKFLTVPTDPTLNDFGEKV